MTSSDSRFGVIDYVVFAVTIAVSLAVGLFFAFRGGQKTNEQYLVGNRKMKLIPVAVSFLVSYMSTLDILGNPAEAYAYGTQYMLYSLACVLGMVIGTFVFVPLYYPLQITSVFEYHRMRFKSRVVEKFAVCLAIWTTLLFTSILIYSPCMAFETVSGCPTWVSMLITGVATILYTSLGGMQAVVWTDCCQAGVILVALIIILVKGTLEVGGVAEVWRINEEWGRVKFFDFSLDPTKRLTFWSVVVLNSLNYVTIVTAQPSVQRFVALPTMTRAKLSALLAMPGLIASGLLTCACGITAFAYYTKKGCDPVTSGKISGPNQIMPYFVMDVLDIPALPGLFVACLFSASLSSVSSQYNAFSAMMWQNFLRHKCQHLPDEKLTTITKLTTGVFGIVAVAGAFVVMRMGGTLIQISFTMISTVSGPLLGMFLMAGVSTRVGPRGVMVGMVMALALCGWIGFGAMFSGSHEPPLPGPTNSCLLPSNETTTPHYLGTTYPVNITTDESPLIDSRSWLEWMYSVSYFYYSTIGVVVVALVSTISSVIPHCEVPQRVPKKHLFPCVRRCCGLEHEDGSDSNKAVGVNGELDTLLGMTGGESTEQDLLQKSQSNDNV